MTYALEEIRQLRKKLDLTQSELAKKANVSQSLIAKIEAGKIDPTYSNATKIFQTLDDLLHHHEKKAGTIMQKRIITVAPEDSLKSVITKMKKFGISQIPVLKDKYVIGLISESLILDAILNKGVSDVAEIMDEAPPIVGTATGITVLSNLLKFYPMVIVKEKGKLCGIITKADILGSY